jgi:hypothetical protein
MTSKQFEDECHSKISSWLWDDNFNQDYQESITLTIAEMRFIANILRKRDGLKQMAPACELDHCKKY